MSKYTHTLTHRQHADDIRMDAILNTPNSRCIAYSHMRAAYYTKKTLQIFSMNELYTCTRTRTRTQLKHKHKHKHRSQCGSMLKRACVCIVLCMILSFSSLCFNMVFVGVCVRCMHVRLFVYVCNGVVAAAEMLSNSSSEACVFMPIYTIYNRVCTDILNHNRMNFKKYGCPMTEIRASFRRRRLLLHL